jgi:hypothetical protein
MSAMEPFRVMELPDERVLRQLPVREPRRPAGTPPSNQVFSPMNHAAPPSTDPQPSGPVLGVTRLAVLGLLILAVANGLFLYLVPGRAAVDYAWSIKPSINAACIGAGYLAGTVATALVVFRARSWRSLRILPPALAALALTALAATIVHEDRFFWDYAPTWVWTAVYAIVPPLVVVFWRAQERLQGPVPAADPRLRPLRVRSAALGAVLAAIGLCLLLLPGVMADVWPWPITPLLSRVIAAWYLLAAAVLLMGALSLRRPHEVPIPYATLAAWSALLLLLPVLYADALTDRPVSLGAWLAVHGLLLVLCAAAVVRALPAMRTAGEHL